ncbi:MAG: glycosyltransferase family 39 protein [Planctomycetes bacterium]|nr:glycosyltransferase family 39 protein [Planctomycetota bacterium]
MTRAQRSALAVTFLVFLALRLPALDQIYHQDEAKWACYVDPVVQANYPEECRPGSIPHPPLGEFLFWLGGAFWGYDRLRVVPLIFATLNFWLLFAIARRRWGTSAAIGACALTAVTFYSVLASVQIDTDGAIMPFWALLAWWAYDRGMASGGRVPTSKLPETTATPTSTRTVRDPADSDDRSVPAPTAPDRHGGRGPWVLFAMACAGGMVTKVSFVLALAAFGLDALWSLGWRGLWKRRLGLLGLAGGIVIGVEVFFSVLQLALYPHGDPFRFFLYADKFPFLNFGSRPWGDIAFQVLKALCYFGPLIPCLAAMAVLASRGAPGASRAVSGPGPDDGRPQGPALRRGEEPVAPAGFRLPLLFLGVHAAFYLVLFDFSGRPLERYLEFSIAPLAMVAGASVDLMLRLERKPWLSALMDALLPSGVVLLLVAATFGSELAPIPLYPKEIMLSRLKDRQFGFLIPFTGGSGPIGFYIPASLVIGVWVIAGAGLLLEWIARGRNRAMALGLIVAAGLGSSGGFLEEYVAGSRYGAMSRQAREVLSHSSLRSPVLTYNDVGLYELRRSGAYGGRFYARPEYWEENRRKILQFAMEGYILVFEFPPMDPAGPYSRLFRGRYRRQHSPAIFRFYYPPHESLIDSPRVRWREPHRPR